MKDDEKHLAEITRREALKKMGKCGLYVPPTLAVLTAAPRAFAGSPEPPAAVTINGTFSSTVTGRPHGLLSPDPSPVRWCGRGGFSLALPWLDPNQPWSIQVSASSNCSTAEWQVGWVLQVSGSDANRGTVGGPGGQYWNVPGGAVAPGETLQVDFSLSS